MQMGTISALKNKALFIINILHFTEDSFLKCNAGSVKRLFTTVNRSAQSCLQSWFQLTGLIIRIFRIRLRLQLI